MKYSNSIYQAFDSALKTPENVKRVLDNVNAKYNTTDWKLLTNVQPEQRTRRWGTILDEAEIAVMATVSDANSPVPVRSIKGIETYEGSIPTMGHGFTLGADDLQHVYEAGYSDDAAMQYLADRFKARTGARLQGIHSRLNFWIWQAMATGTMTVSAENNPDGIAFTYAYKMLPENKQCAKGAATAKWTNVSDTSTADPIADIQRWCRMMEDDRGVSDIMLVMNKNTFRLFLHHPSVVAQIKNMTNLANVVGLTSLKDADLWRLIRDAFGLPPIYVIDVKQTVESNGVPTVVESPFKDNVVSVVPRGQIFDLYHCPSTFTDMTSPDILVSSTENGLIYSLKEYSNNGRVTKWSFQTVAAPILRNPKNLIIANVDKNSSTGVLPE